MALTAVIMETLLRVQNDHIPYRFDGDLLWWYLFLLIYCCATQRFKVDFSNIEWSWCCDKLWLTVFTGISIQTILSVCFFEGWKVFLLFLIAFFFFHTFSFELWWKIQHNTQKYFILCQGPKFKVALICLTKAAILKKQACNNEAQTRFDAPFL